MTSFTKRKAGTFPSLYQRWNAHFFGYKMFDQKHFDLEHGIMMGDYILATGFRQSTQLWFLSVQLFAGWRRRLLQTGTGKRPGLWSRFRLGGGERGIQTAVDGGVRFLSGRRARQAPVKELWRHFGLWRKRRKRKDPAPNRMHLEMCKKQICENRKGKDKRRHVHRRKLERSSQSRLRWYVLTYSVCTGRMFDFYRDIEATSGAHVREHVFRHLTRLV